MTCSKAVAPARAVTRSPRTSVAAQFAAYGLQPGGTGGWFQRVAFQRTSYVPGGSFVAISGPKGEQRFVHGGESMVRLHPRELTFDLEAPLVFVGFGMTNERFKLDDYRGLDVKGKIVVVLTGFPKGLPSEEGAHLDSIKAQEAERHGAVGILAVRTLQADRSYPWERAHDVADDPYFDWVHPDGRVNFIAETVGARATVNRPVANAIFAGAPRSLESVLAAADKPNASPRGFALKTRARIHAEGKAERVPSPNVIGLLRGSDPVLADQYVVLSAHLDHIGIATAKPDAPDADVINNGALDNAAGVATMLEVARAAAAAGTKPRRSIVFLATTGEEEGLRGADYYAHYPTVPIRQVVGNVDLDMPVLLYPFTDVIAFGANHSSFGPLVSRAVGSMGLALSPDPMPQEGIFTRSDHYMFVKQGVPAVFLATGFANGGEKAWDAFLAGPYHHPGDDLKQPIDWAAGARFAEANYRITRAMADADEPPRWNAGDFFGDTFAPDAPRERVASAVMVTKLDRPLRREVTIRKRAYIVTLDVAGLKLTLKGHRKGQELKWDDWVSGEAALAVALNASLAQANDAAPPPRGRPARPEVPPRKKRRRPSAAL